LDRFLLRPAVEVGEHVVLGHLADGVVDVAAAHVQHGVVLGADAVQLPLEPVGLLGQLLDGAVAPRQERLVVLAQRGVVAAQLLLLDQLALVFHLHGLANQSVALQRIWPTTCSIQPLRVCFGRSSGSGWTW